MTAGELASAKRDIEATADLLSRAMKLSGLLTSLFQSRGFRVSDRLAALKKEISRG